MLVSVMYTLPHSTVSRQQRAFTLVELLVTISVMAVMLMLAAPSLSDFMRKQRILTTTDAITSAIGQARTRALASSSYITIAPIGGDWKNGWQVFSEGQNPDGLYTAGTDTLINQYDPLPTGMSITYSSTAFVGGVGANSGNYLIYGPNGYTTSVMRQPQVLASFYVAYSQGGGITRRVIVNPLGRARTCDPAADATCVATASQ